MFTLIEFKIYRKIVLYTYYCVDVLASRLVIKLVLTGSAYTDMYKTRLRNSDNAMVNLGR